MLTEPYEPPFTIADVVVERGVDDPFEDAASSLPSTTATTFNVKAVGDVGDAGEAGVDLGCHTSLPSFAIDAGHAMRAMGAGLVVGAEDAIAFEIIIYACFCVSC